MFHNIIFRWQRVCQRAAVLVSALTFCSTIPLHAAPSAPAQDRVVVIISMDGLGGTYLDDPKADLPTLRKLAAEGVVCDNMKSVLPTLTWPNHTSLITGVTPRRHGVLGNDYWDRQTKKSVRLITDPIFDKDEIVKAPTLYDVAHEAGLKTAAICWPATRGVKTLDWTVPDVHSNQIVLNYSTPQLLNEFRVAGIPYEKQELWCNTDKGRERDIMYTQMFLHVLKRHRPDLALLHLVEVDHAQHAKGPGSAEAYDAVHFEDERVKEVVDALEKEFPGRATLFVLSDHGFASVRQRIQPNVKLRQAGLLKVAGGKIADSRVFAFNQGGSSFVYVLDDANRNKLIKQVAAMFQGVEGIDQVILPADFKKRGLVSSKDDPRMADLVLTAKNGFSFSENATDDAVVTPVSEKTTGAHGHNPLLPGLQASFIAWGHGIKKGAKLEQINNLDVAPTAAAVLGVKMKNVEGKVLKEALAN